MTVQSVIKEVCSFVGVRPPNGTVFTSPYQDRTAWEFVQLANEIGQRIAYNTRDWGKLMTFAEFDGSASQPELYGSSRFVLPADYKRMLLNSNIRLSTNPRPLSFISDYDEWIERRLNNSSNGNGEWILLGDILGVYPLVPVGTKVIFPYLNKNFIFLASGGGGRGDQFVNDADTFMLDERLLKLGLIWQWKANKGATYAEDLATYEDALSRTGGSDKPSPIIVGSQPISSNANIAYWGPTPAGSTFVGPGP